MRKSSTLFAFLALLLLPYFTQAQLLQDADKIIMRLRVVCNNGQGGALVVALDIKPRVNGTQRRFGGFNTVLGFTDSKLNFYGTQQRYGPSYWPGR